MISILHLSSTFPLPFLHNRQFLSAPLKSFTKSHVCFSLSSSDDNQIGYNAQEEARWLREEQRWLREEQRWLREEHRWKGERQGLIQEINSLQLRIQELEQSSSLPAEAVSDTVANIAKLMQVLKEGDLGWNIQRIPESGSSAMPQVVEAALANDEVVVKEIVSVPNKNETAKRRGTLRSGSEGDDVQAMQEALQKLGFYSGEEDMEFSCFSSGTERAVKTWQATIGAKEDGIMTAELLEQLFMDKNIGNSGAQITKNEENKGLAAPKKSDNGAPIVSTTDVSEFQKFVVTKEGASEFDASQNRVFLLGENRWEDPSRLSKTSKPVAVPKSGSTTKCLACRGEGSVLCMECDGTGEPNVEPQFMEWIDEGFKCPYCDGLGYSTCDSCGGTALADA